jgi:hypothetical protein
MGTHERVEKAEVIWPGGKTEILNNLAADRFYTVQEGAGVVRSESPGFVRSRQR